MIHLRSHRLPYTITKVLREQVSGGRRASQKGLWAMKKFLFAIGVLVLGLTATAPAHADFAIVKFNSGYCRIYDNTAWAPPDGTFVWFVWGYHRYYHLPTLPIAQHKLGLVVARHLCWHE